MRKIKVKKILIILGIILLLSGIGIGGFWGYKYLKVRKARLEEIFEKKFEETSYLYEEALIGASSPSEQKAGFKKVAIELESLLKMKPNNEETLKKLVELYRNLEEYDKAIEYAKKLLKLRPEKADYYWLLGNIYLVDKFDLNRAEEFYKKALQKNPNHLPSYIDLARIYKSQNKKELLNEIEEKLKELMK